MARSVNSGPQALVEAQECKLWAGRPIYWEGSHGVNRRRKMKLSTTGD